MSHTPGPWESDFKAGAFVIRDQASRARTIAQVVYWTTEDTDNARLIAAAPALLEALRSILEIGKRDLSNPKYDGYFESARAAIAKADGR